MCNGDKRRRSNSGSSIFPYQPYAIIQYRYRVYPSHPATSGLLFLPAEDSEKSVYRSEKSVDRSEKSVDRSGKSEPRSP